MGQAPRQGAPRSRSTPLRLFTPVLQPIFGCHHTCPPAGPILSVEKGPVTKPRNAYSPASLPRIPISTFPCPLSPSVVPHSRSRAQQSLEQSPARTRAGRQHHIEGKCSPRLIQGGSTHSREDRGDSHSFSLHWLLQEAVPQSADRIKDMLTAYSCGCAPPCHYGITAARLISAGYSHTAERSSVTKSTSECIFLPRRRNSSG